MTKHAVINNRKDISAIRYNYALVIKLYLISQVKVLVLNSKQMRDGGKSQSLQTDSCTHLLLQAGERRNEGHGLDPQLICEL